MVVDMLRSACIYAYRSAGCLFWITLSLSLIHTNTRPASSQVCLYLDFGLDESYAPKKICVRKDKPPDLTCRLRPRLLPLAAVCSALLCTPHSYDTHLLLLSAGCPLPMPHAVLLMISSLVCIQVVYCTRRACVCGKPYVSRRVPACCLLPSLLCCTCTHTHTCTRTHTHLLVQVRAGSTEADLIELVSGRPDIHLASHLARPLLLLLLTVLSCPVLRRCWTWWTP